MAATHSGANARLLARTRAGQVTASARDQNRLLAPRRLAAHGTGSGFRAGKRRGLRVCTAQVTSISPASPVPVRAVAVDLRVPKRYLNAKDGCLRRDVRAVDCAMALCVAAAHRACRDALQTDSDLLA